MHLRPLRRGQRELVARFYAGLSAESRRRRFLQPMPRPPKAILRRLLDVDGSRHVAVVGEADGECVGIAHAVALADEPGAAEVAVAVTDRYQGRGIGRLLLAALRPAAIRAALATLVYLVDPTNRPALRLLRSRRPARLPRRPGRGPPAPASRRPRPHHQGDDMGDRHVSVIINAPPETVFGLYTDPGRARDWLSGVREVRTTSPPDQPGSRAVIAYRWPFKMTSEVLQVQPPDRHVQRLKELLGLVTCTTTARFRRVEGGTQLRLEMHYRVAGGPSAASSTPGSGTRWSPRSAGTWPGSRRWPRSKLGHAGLPPGSSRSLARPRA